MAAIFQNLEHLCPNFALPSGTTQDTCVQNIIRIPVKLRGLGPEQRSPYTFWILLRRRRWLQTNQTHIGPPFHVGPNKEQACFCEAMNMQQQSHCYETMRFSSVLSKICRSLVQIFGKVEIFFLKISCKAALGLLYKSSFGPRNNLSLRPCCNASRVQVLHISWHFSLNFKLRITLWTMSECLKQVT